MSLLRVLSLAVLGSVGVLSSTLDWDCGSSVEACNNACFAVNCKGAAYFLTYDSDAADWPTRRTASGSGLNPCSGSTAQRPFSDFGNSSDEFPFASVKEGGDGATLRCIQPNESSSEASQLTSFYKTLTNGDQYRIGIKNYYGAQYCINGTYCTNDGAEFHLNNGVFGAEKRARHEASTFELDVPSTTGTPRGFRRFMGEDGVERLSLAGPDTDLVGTQVWSEDAGLTKLVYEIHE